MTAHGLNGAHAQMRPSSPALEARLFVVNQNSMRGAFHILILP